MQDTEKGPDVHWQPEVLTENPQWALLTQCMALQKYFSIILYNCIWP